MSQDLDHMQQSPYNHYYFVPGAPPNADAQTAQILNFGTGRVSPPSPCYEPRLINTTSVQRTFASVLTTPPLGKRPCVLTCPCCRANVLSRVKPVATTKTHAFALVLALSLIFLPCAPLPYYVDALKGKNHYCPSCGAYLGTYNI